MASERATLFDTVKKLETEIGVTPGFLERLLTDGDDWSFVIKVHAVAETALTHLLTAGVGRKELRGMCCNFPKAARERLVESAWLRLMPPPRTSC